MRRWHAAHQRWHAANDRLHAARRRWRHSLKWRLLTLFLLVALGTTVVFLFGMQKLLRGGWESYARPIVADYLDRMAAEIGSPPDVGRAAALVARLPITLRIEGPQVQYDSHPRLHEDATWRNERRGPEEWGLVRRTADGHRITFGLTKWPEGHPRIFGWVTLAALLAMTALAFGIVRHLVRPLEAIGAGVARFGTGDFSQSIVVHRRDELGDLAERANLMARNLQGMLDAKRALLLAISHELRSPLTRARVNAELVPEGEARDALLRDLGEMRDLISDLLESERLASGHRALHTEAVDLAALVREVVGSAFVGRGVVLHLPDALAPVQADLARLRLLMRNLIDNALRHGGPEVPPPEVTLSLGDDGTLDLAVRDHGPGVSDEQLARLSEPFYRTDAARGRGTGGVGLGLYLCRLVAQAHGGDLRIEQADPGLRVVARWTPPAGSGREP